ncbi:MAG TPA: hypothetical protein VMT56_04420 [Candidatus Bathyarchaeia archaeon]|nr:hypothetical protein [Candidatus Bathyarchaeia archaeon]
MRKPRTLGPALCLLLTLTPSLLRAQVATGTPPFGSFGGGPEVINLANLNAHISIPVIQKAGRGMPFSYVLSYDTVIWTPVPVNGVNTWQPVNNWGWTASTQVTTGYVTYSKTMYKCTFFPVSYDTVYQNYVYYDYFGAAHPFNLYLDFGECGTPDSGPWTAVATDGSGYTLTTQYGSDATITDRSGWVFNPPVNSKGGSGTKTDTNGNQITVNTSGQFFDTLSSTTPVLTVSGAKPNPVTFQYTAPSQNLVSYTMNYTTYTVATNFAVSNIAEYGRTSVALVDNIALPDGTKYLFRYEQTPSIPAAGACTPLSGTFQSYCVTGRLYSVTLPTGGEISYSYSGGGTGVNGIWSDGSTATLTRQTPDGTWTYAQVKGSGAASTTTITDPQGNQTVMQFQGIYETERQVYQGSSGSGTLLQTVNTCYNGSTSPCTSTAVSLPISRRTVTTQFPGGSASKVDTFWNTYGLLTENDEYDYGASGLIRKTLITYATLGNNINSATYTVKVQDGNGNLAAQTNYIYDQTAVTTTSGIPQHVSVSGSRGNLTTIQYFTTSGTTIQKTFTYYDTGTLNTSVDVNNATTTYNYGSNSCGNSFPTSVNKPLNLSRSMQWNCTGGVQTSLTDENGQTTTTTYTDSYFWPLLSKLAVNGASWTG